MGTNNNNITNKKWLLFALVALSISVNVYFRLNSLFLWPFDKTAKIEVYDNLKNELYEKVKSAYPDLADTDREKFINILLKQAIKQNKLEIKRDILMKSNELKSYFQDENGWTYLLEIDPYRWYRYVDNFLNTGHFGTNRIGSQEYDNLRSAPYGHAIEPLKIHYYISVYFYKIMHSINNKLSLMTSLSFLPVFLSVFMVIGVFFVSLLLGFSSPAAFIASLAIGLSPPVLMRSSFGWFDTDIYNIFFPLVIISVLAYSFRKAGLKHAFLLILGGILLGIYSAIWSVWWLTLYILIVSLCLYDLNIIFYDKQNNVNEKIRNSILSISIFIISTLIAVFFISGPEAIKKVFWEPFYCLNLKQNVAIDKFWPNLTFFSVAEIRNADIITIVNGVGGNFVLYGSLIGLLLITSFKRGLMDFKGRSFLLFVLLVWLILMLIMASFAVRFILFLSVPIGILFAAFLDMLKDFIKAGLNKINFLMKINKKIIFLFSNSIFLIAAVMLLHNSSGKMFLPFLNDNWWNMLVEIRESTPKNSIINTYWDWGDWIMSISKRATVNCAALQQTPIPYWVSKALLTNDEKEARGIFRMLDSGGNMAFQELTSLLDYNKLASFDLMNKIILLNKEDGYVLLNKYSNNKDGIDRVLEFTYSSNRPAYVLVYSRLLDVMQVLGASANWDFRKNDLWQNFSALKKEDFINYAINKFGYSKEKSKEIYASLLLTDKNNILDWIAKGNEYRVYTSMLQNKISGIKENLILFDNGLIIDKENLKSYFRDDVKENWIKPGRLIFVDKDSLKENLNREGDKDYTVLFLESDNIYKAVLLSSQLADTLFARLYFMNGIGLKLFQLVHKEEDKKTHEKIYLYKINWEDKGGKRIDG